MNLPPSPEYTQMFTTLNHSTSRAFTAWSLREGMKYGDISKWWDDSELRKNPHEGLDLAVFVDADNREHHLQPGLVVPPVYSGRVLSVLDDFLGSTIIMEHDITTGNDLRLLSFMAHLLPDLAINPGAEVQTNGRLGEIAQGNNFCPPHLHISTAWVTHDFSIANFSWNNFHKQNGFHPCDPQEFIAL